MKILPLGTYDAILGMDWLEAHSLMMVDWIAKYAIISTSSGAVHLRGNASAPTGQEINSLLLMSLYKQGSLSHVVHLFHVELTDEDAGPIPTAIDLLIREFEDVFGEP